MRIFGYALFCAASVVGDCANPKQRPSWRLMSEQQKSGYMNAIKQLKARPEGDANDWKSWNYDQFVKCHWEHVPEAHGVPAFLPWHRMFTLAYEQAIQSIDPSIMLPYWDWSLDSQNPSQADLFHANYFGGTGQGVDGCVQDGVAAGWQTVYPGSSNRPGNACLKRCFNFTVLYSPEAIAANLNTATSFDSVRKAIEGGSHGLVHQQIGGSCGDMASMYSTNDPLFFMHHVMIDKVWWRWQNGCTSYQHMYDGPNSAPDEIMKPFK